MNHRLRSYGAVLVTVTALAATTVGPPSSDASDVARARPRLAVTAVSDPPSTASPGTTWTVTTTVENAGKARARASRTTYFLSRDKARGNDVRLSATSKVRSLRPGARATVRARLKVPGGLADASYHLIACTTGNACRASAGRTAVTSPLRGTLTGTIVFDDAESSSSGDTVESRHDHAVAHIRIDVDESREGWDVFDNAGSTYSYSGDYSRVWTTDQCIVDTSDVAAGSGPLIQVGDQYDDDLLGDFGRLDHSELDLLLGLRYHHTTTEKKTSRTELGCIPGTTTTGPTPSRDLSEIEFHEVRRTATAIVYDVHSVLGPYGVPTDWDTVTGRLTLTLR